MPADTTSPIRQTSRSQRILACVLCQQRKVKCDRRFPCANCTKSNAQCVPATQVQRRRRRRFAEKDLLERLRGYEDLLRQNDVVFDPLHSIGSTRQNRSNSEQDGQPEEPDAEVVAPGSSTLSIANESEQGYEAKNVWHAMSKGFRDPDDESDSSHDDLRADVVQNAWDHLKDNDDHLLLGSRKTDVDLSTLHPNPAQIFRLWQLYLDNVNPFLKVTHTSSLQARIVEAASDVSKLDTALGALMFGIYSMAILSLSSDDCQRLFTSSKEDLLMRYHFGCQQALLNCNVLRTSDRDCLVAFFLYLTSIRPSTNPQALSSMLGIAIRIAERMGIHNEASLSRCTIFEAEMRRRLWWSLVHLDARTTELADSRASILNPTWDCKIPLNVNDSDLRPQMKEPPATQGKCTEAIYVVVRSEIGNYIRHADFHLDFTNPALKPIANLLRKEKNADGDDLIKLQRMIDDQYLRFCDTDNPVHFMTIWTLRAHLGKCLLLRHHAVHSGLLGRQTNAQLDSATSYALYTLECDTKVMTSSLTTSFRWANQFHFPFPAYMQILQDIRKRPNGKSVEKAWELMNDHHNAWFGSHFKEEGPFFQVFAKMVLQAWRATEGASTERSGILAPPFVSYIQSIMEQGMQSEPEASTQPSEAEMDAMIDQFTIPLPMSFPSPSMPYTMAFHPGFGMMRPYLYPGQSPLSSPITMMGSQVPEAGVHDFMKF